MADFTAPPTSTHIVESSVVHAPIGKVWSSISSLDFSFWGLVESSQPQDGVKWTIQLCELSQISHSLTFEVISSDPPSMVSSVVHTISLKRVTSDNTTFVEWITDFSNDATAEIISDSTYKRKDALRNLDTTAKASV